jgi:5-methylcytosine-specific restriction protein A
MKDKPIERIRGRRLQTIRVRHLSANPLCVMCERKGLVRLATQLDHIVALTNGGTNDDDNYQGLCEPCHIDKTAMDLGRAAKHVTGVDGWPIEQGRGGSKV